MSGMRLMKRWNCDSSRCSNIGHLCWQPFANNVRYYKLFNEDISRWNIAISIGKTNVEVPPILLKESFYLKDKLKRVSGRKKKKMGVSQFAIIIIQPPFFRIIYHQFF